MCFSLVFACLSVCLSVSRSVWGLDLRSLALLPTPPTPPCPTLGTEPGTGMVPNPGGSVAGPGPLYPLWLQRPVCVRVCTCMYMGNLCASMYKG